MVAVGVNISEHPKVPPLEQRLSAGCEAHANLLATEASGFAGIWRTGAASLDRAVMTGLGLAPSEEIIGFLYLGTRAGAAKFIPAQDTADFVSIW